MIDLGKKWDKPEAVTPGTEEKVHYPNIHIEKDIGLDEKDVGKTIDAKVRIKVTSVSKRADENKKTESSDLDILGISIDKTEFAKELKDQLSK